MSQFPTELDVLSDLHGSRDSVLTRRIQELNEAVTNIETKVGIDGSLDVNSLDYKVDNFAGGAVWGGITGTLSDQIDLQAALDAKAAVSHTHAAADGFTTLVSTGDQDVENAQNTDHALFQFAVTASKRYLVDMLVAASGNNTTGDFECRFAVAAGTMNGAGTMQSLAAALGIQHSTITAAAAATTADLVTGVSGSLEFPIAVRICFAFVPDTTTTLKFQFGNNAAAAGRISRVMQGSIMRYKQMN